MCIRDRLIYDIIIGFDYLKRIQTKFDFCNQIMECKVKNKLYKIKLNEPIKKYTTYKNEVIAINKTFDKHTESRLKR